MRDYSELRAKAEAATPGEWRIATFGQLSVQDGRYMLGVADAGFIRAAQPQTILALLDELEALRAQVKPVKPKRIVYPPEFDIAYEAMVVAGVKWRPGSTQKAALIQWKARINAGATPIEMIAGAENYARYCKATGCEIKMAQTFFGQGEHFSADWTVRAPQQTARPGKFDPVAHINQGRASSGEWDGIIDITPR